MLDFKDFFSALPDTPLQDFAADFDNALQRRLAVRTYGDLVKWQDVLQSLPAILPDHTQLSGDTVSIGSAVPLPDSAREQLQQNLMQLAPWRKGPFSLFGLQIDTEWRSDWKWQRVQPHIQPLADRMVLDVGCGNGYHCWRMRGDGARFVLGVDPMIKFLYQFRVFKHYLQHEPVFLLPMTSEDVPATGLFDTVFSMGVLYHRKSPLTHLEELKQSLRQGGELVLETLVVDGDEKTVLMPEDRYACMPNVWFIPSTRALENWLHRLGFDQIRTVDVNRTSTDEQRSTAWMPGHSLAQFLDPDNPQLSREGYPAPQRAIILANKR